MTAPTRPIPILKVDMNRLSAVGMLKITEDATCRAGNMVLLRFPQGEEILVLGSAQHVRFWQRHQNCFRKEVDILPSSSAVGRLLLDESLSTARDGEEWHRIRRLSIPHVQPTIESLRRATAQATEWLIAELTHAKASVSLPDVCVRWSLKAVCAPLLGTAVREQEVMDFLEQFRVVYFNLISKAEKDNIDQLRRDPAASSLRATMHALVDAALSPRRARHQSMISYLHRQLASEMLPVKARSVLRSVVIGTLAASVDNVAATLLWTLIHLSRAPKISERIAGEADETKFEDWRVASTPLAHAAVRETLRLTPVQPLIERTTTFRMDLSGHEVCPGINVFFSPWLVHRSAENWVDPLTYDIERFRPGQKIDLACYFPFGVDKRICIGLNLSLYQLTLAVSKVCRDIKFSLSECCKPGNLKPIFRLNLAPRGPVHIEVAPRRRALPSSPTQQS